MAAEIEPSKELAEMIGCGWRVTRVYRLAQHRAMPLTVEVERAGGAISYRAVERAPVVPLASLTVWG